MRLRNLLEFTDSRAKVALHVRSIKRHGRYGSEVSYELIEFLYDKDKEIGRYKYRSFKNDRKEIQERIESLLDYKVENFGPKIDITTVPETVWLSVYVRK